MICPAPFTTRNCDEGFYTMQWRSWASLVTVQYLSASSMYNLICWNSMWVTLLATWTLISTITLNTHVTGLHRESFVYTTIFGLLFWDIIYKPGITDTFFSCYQYQPLDLQTDEFYPRRKEDIDRRLTTIRNCASQVR